MIVGKEYRFEAAHHLPMTPEDHPCHNRHDHSYTVLVLVDGPLQDNGFVMEYQDISEIVKPLIEQLDHSMLNECIGNPTAENIAIWFFEKLIEQLPMLVAIEVRETATSLARYTFMDHQIKMQQN